ncbi:MAG: hypothetical protein RIT19_1247 [Verrucomicrobiota bacterium]
MAKRIFKGVVFLAVAVILIEKIRVRYYYRIWNHPDSLILAAALAEAYPERFKGIADAKGSDPEWLSGELRSSRRADDNLVRMTNVLRGPSNEVFTEVVYSYSGSSNRLWNTDAWEVASRYQFNIQLKGNPEFAEILSILQEEPAVQRSQRLYTGALSVIFTQHGVTQSVRSIHHVVDRLRWLQEGSSSADAFVRELNRITTKNQIDWHRSSITNSFGSLRQAFYELYGSGGIPEATVQRLMAIGTRAAD